MEVGGTGGVPFPPTSFFLRGPFELLVPTFHVRLRGRKTKDRDLGRVRRIMNCARSINSFAHLCDSDSY